MTTSKTELDSARGTPTPSNSLTQNGERQFAGACAVVTGSSSGIGQEAAIAFADAGVSHLLVHYRNNRSGAMQTQAAARAAGCEHVRIVQADLAKSQDREKLIDEAFGLSGQVNIWVNNAGADVLTGPAAELDFYQKLQILWDVDVLSTIKLSRSLAIRLRSQKPDLPASIVFIGWDQASEGMEGDAGQMFGTTKAAIMAFAQSLSQELAPETRVNTVAPGWIKTKWGESTSDYWEKRGRDQALMNRWGKPEDVARAILYVANPANSFTTGQTICVNGGWNRAFAK